ncbi:hypothetical protein NKJ06_23920 [Mesorhizobium sp. M0293]|uniref:hypothetical protein n=1 Tax=unclassified Mesorhizobium TaxID=325217 RepID=UPI00333B461C
MLTLLGFPIAFILGLSGFAWWTVIFPTVLAIIGAARSDPARAQRTQFGNPLIFAWAVLPFLGLWWIGSLF